MSDAKVVISKQVGPEEGTLVSYTAGYLISVVVTLIAYELVSRHAFTRYPLEGVVSGLAIVQFFVQLVLFLHIGKELRPRWKLLVFCFMIMVVLIIVFGSLWIMSNLNTRMTMPQMIQYMNSQDGL
jgi:cytochrome o ubiquinol oxidase operon protein cyoD